LHFSRFRVFLALAMVAVLARAAAGDAGEVKAADLVHAKLLADTTAVRAGQPFLLGVLLEIKPGYHIYWQNPGDSGAPTTVVFTAPEGYAVSPLQFPVPQRIDQPGDEVVYGYTGSVLLMAEVRPSRGGGAIAAARAVTVDATAAFSADVSWLCCDKACIPGKSQGPLELPANVEPERANEALFSEWKARVPVPLGGKAAPATGSITPSLSVNSLVFSGVLHWDAVPAEVQFFPAPEDALKVSDISVKTDKADTQVRFKASVLKGQKLTGNRLTTLVAARDANGAWRGVLVECKLDQLFPK
jgi:DsbC/DsbD-like thiol-disulfide interchange protein